MNASAAVVDPLAGTVVTKGMSGSDDASWIRVISLGTKGRSRYGNASKTGWSKESIQTLYVAAHAHWATVSNADTLASAKRVVRTAGLAALRILIPLRGQDDAFLIRPDDDVDPTSQP